MTTSAAPSSLVTTLADILTADHQVRWIAIDWGRYSLRPADYKAVGAAIRTGGIKLVIDTSLGKGTGAGQASYAMAGNTMSFALGFDPRIVMDFAYFLHESTHAALDLQKRGKALASTVAEHEALGYFVAACFAKLAGGWGKGATDPFHAIAGAAADEAMGRSGTGKFVSTVIEPDPAKMQDLVNLIRADPDYGKEPASTYDSDG